MNPATWIASTLFFVILLLADSVFAGDYVLAPLPEAYPDRSDFEGELSEPLKDPKACEL